MLSSNIRKDINLLAIWIFEIIQYIKWKSFFRHVTYVKNEEKKAKQHMDVVWIVINKDVDKPSMLLGNYVYEACYSRLNIFKITTIASNPSHSYWCFWDGKLGLQEKKPLSELFKSMNSKLLWSSIWCFLLILNKFWLTGTPLSYSCTLMFLRYWYFF